MDRDLIKKQISQSSEYSQISSFTINRLIDEGIKRFKKDKDIVKYVKKELHIVWRAFFKQNIKWEEAIQKDINQLVMAHNSTNERQAFVIEFYKQIFENIDGKISKIADYGCGLNPLNIPQMDLQDNIQYSAYDIYVPEVEFLNTYAAIHFKDIQFHAEVKDAFEEDSQSYDVVFMLKLLPVLEEQKKGASMELLKRINTRNFVVSFPTRSLSGKNVGMLSNYSQSFENVLNDLRYEYSQIIFENEVVYVVKKSV